MRRRADRIRLFGGLAVGLVSWLLAFAGARAEPASITVVSTTSTDNSGLLDALVPPFTAETGIRVRIIAVGTGQALRIGRNGDADALLVHHPPSELAFVAAGFGVERRPVMRNDFVIVGPARDPAGVRGMSDAAAAFARIADARAAFVSRGDESGTHHKERELWATAGLDPAGARDSWYRETGSGQGANLNVASAMAAYALTDRATWLKFANKGPLMLLSEGDERLINPYHAMLVNPARHPHVNADDARRFLDWLSPGPGQTLIAAYRVNGAPAFVATGVASAAAGAADRPGIGP